MVTMLLGADLSMLTFCEECAASQLPGVPFTLHSKGCSKHDPSTCYTCTEGRNEWPSQR